MTRNDYLKKLDKYLKKLPQKDYEEAMEYFTEYFDEAGSENEEQVIQELGDPGETANEILSNLLKEKANHTNSSPKNYAAIVWIAILAVFASPIALPLAFAFIGFLLTFLIMGAAFIFILFTFALTGLITGVAIFIDGIRYLSVTAAGSSMGVGLGLLCVGLALLAILAGSELSKWFSRGTVRLVRWTIKKGRGQ
ncbi:DUF1700 domain-containing protein [Streptococcus dentapri]|uniref:DUF1700 domain-containing protein n=1 Tax=Streptococcus dentapri TaxID=573564 RepID=A0ABV8CYT9_9STRE